LDFSVQMIKGLVSDISETDEKLQKQSIGTDDVSTKEKIIDIIAQMHSITVTIVRYKKYMY
jgi:hypothetical protein